MKQYEHRGRIYGPGRGTFKTNRQGLDRLAKADRLWPTSTGTIQYVRFFDDFPVMPIANIWSDTGTGSFTDDKVYVVQTGWKVVERCLLMTTDPGDLVLDPTCGSGTTASVAEQWGRRWITIDTSRVALALARARVMGARYPFYLLQTPPKASRRKRRSRGAPLRRKPTHGDIRQGFVYERAPHIMLSDIANDAEIDVIWERFQEEMEPLRLAMNTKRGLELDEWQVPREPGDPWPRKARKQHDRFMRVTTDATRQKAVDRINEIMGRDYTIDTLPDAPRGSLDRSELLKLHEKWWELRLERQQEIDAVNRRQGRFRVPVRQAIRRRQDGACRRTIHCGKPEPAPDPRRQ